MRCFDKITKFEQIGMMEESNAIFSQLADTLPDVMVDDIDFGMNQRVERKNKIECIILGGAQGKTVVTNKRRFAYFRKSFFAFSRTLLGEFDSQVTAT